jgi:hypothetical protein
LSASLGAISNKFLKKIYSFNPIFTRLVVLLFNRQSAEDTQPGNQRRLGAAAAGTSRAEESAGSEVPEKQ